MITGNNHIDEEAFCFLFNDGEGIIMIIIIIAKMQFPKRTDGKFTRKMTNEMETKLDRLRMIIISVKEYGHTEKRNKQKNRMS